MPVYLLNEQPVFPPATEAEPDGLLAIGGDLSVERLISAYSGGIFPWFEEENAFFWFSPDPRLVLFPGKIKISRSLERIIKSGKFEVRMDTAFREVITNCSKVTRPDGDDSWINKKFIEGYTALHQAGFAHSIEAYYNGKLSGGLYGVSLGKAFFGESMFHKVTDASKVAFSYLSGKIFDEWNFDFIDCQVETSHLISMGAENISRKKYLELLAKTLKKRTRKGPWKSEP
ncbi:MAG: leucyl/phenylalanyl-tRNA--protein transferase [Bacteroidota bacterium]|nr:leucyl/phenylalanyl-tRNA--protein transferase [Bacteroidota bacterium]